MYFFHLAGAPSGHLRGALRLASKYGLLLLLLLIGGVGGYLASRLQVPWADFEKLSPEDKLERIIEERDYAINKAARAGVYACCINPPCTMCYMEANEWNNYQAGTCACDDLIVQGKEPCPQCERGLCQDSGDSCSF